MSDADRALVGGDPARAEGLYATRLTGPAALAASAGLVKSQMEQNKLAEALSSAHAAAGAMSSSAEAQVLVGDVLLRSGHIPEASAAFSAALSLDPCSPRAQFGVGRIADLTSHHASAARKFALAHKLAPNDAEITAALAMTMPETQRAVLLRDLLASTPLLSPANVERLREQLAITDQHISCSPSQEFQSAKLELDPIFFNGSRPRSWGLKVRLNESGAPLLELDPSVSGIVLSTKEAEHDGVRPLMGSGAPASASYKGVAARVRIGGLEYHDCPVTVVPASALAEHNGLIGTDFFRDHLIYIDYVAKVLSLDPYPIPPGAAATGMTDRYQSPEEREWSPVYIAGANVLLPTMINGKGPFLFVLDTGTFQTVLAPKVAAAELSATEDLTANLIGTSGEIVKVMKREDGPDTNHPEVHGADGGLLPVTTPRRNVSLRFDNTNYGDNFRYDNTSYGETSPVSFDLSAKSHATGIEISGLLGFWVLQNFMIDINYRDGLVHIPYDINHRYWVRYVNKLY